MHWVTLDQGNSSLKWCVWEGLPRRRAAILRRGRWVEEDIEAGLLELWSHLALMDEVQALYCGVVGAERAEFVRACWERASGGAAWEESRGMMAVQCEEPERVGMDRRFAAEGAHALVGSCVVVDAGTAVTVDAVGRGPVFLGGAIAPGPEVLASSLASAGAQLFSVDPKPGVRALGQTTAEALEAGISVGFAGACARLVLEVAEEAGLGEAPVVVTGGARSFLDREGLFGGRSVHAFADLVHLGLLTAAGVAAELQEDAWPRK